MCAGGPLNFIELLMDRRVPLFMSQSQIQSQTIRDESNNNSKYNFQFLASNILVWCLVSNFRLGIERLTDDFASDSSHLEWNFTCMYIYVSVLCSYRIAIIHFM